MSINPLDVAAALMKMTTMEYKLGNGYFLKELLGKKYTLPTMVLDAVIDYFCKTGMQDSEELPTGEEDEEEYERASPKRGKEKEEKPDQKRGRSTIF